MALKLDLTDSSGNVFRDVYARLKRTQNALVLSVDVFEAGADVAPARIIGSVARPYVKAAESVVQTRINGAAELIFTLDGRTIGGDLVSLEDTESTRQALVVAATGDLNATLTLLYEVVKHRLQIDPAYTGRISNVRDV